MHELPLRVSWGIALGRYLIFRNSCRKVQPRKEHLSNLRVFTQAQKLLITGEEILPFLERPSPYVRAKTRPFFADGLACSLLRSFDQGKNMAASTASWLYCQLLSRRHSHHIAAARPQRVAWQLCNLFFTIISNGRGERPRARITAGPTGLCTFYSPSPFHHFCYPLCPKRALLFKKSPPNGVVSAILRG